jgi:Zn-dependent protease
MMADKLGDDTPRRQGRVTLNPLAHADPIGTLLLPLLGGLWGAAGLGVGAFGWGKPVQWQPSRVRRGIKMSTATILVSVAGPGMNLVLGTVLALINAVLVWQGVVSHGGEADKILQFATNTNFVLLFFNLLPIPPLDGGHVLSGLMPYKHRAAYESFARFGPFVVMVVAFNSQLARVFLVPAVFCADHVRGMWAHLFGLSGM